jgi:mannose-6-phosphate isomerase-like protein (cupin superfamily)
MQTDKTPQYIFHEPKEYGFRDRDGHDGKFFGTDSPTTQHMIVECTNKLTVHYTQKKVEFSYYITEGSGYFVLNGDKQVVAKGDLVVVPPGTKYTFGGKLKMLLINTPHWSSDQEVIEQIGQVL